jgi:hypothetical protein
MHLLYILPYFVIPSGVEGPCVAGAKEQPAIYSKIGFLQNLVKPPNAPNSRQPPDSVAEINLTIWRVYPSGFAILKVEIK